jgi:predicted glycosyltransferase
MRVLFQLGHPAHFHLFKNTIADLQRDGHETFILIRKKDILEDLLKKSGMPYINILPSGKKSVFTLMLRLWRVFWFTLTHRVDVLVGSTPEVAQVAWLLRRRSVVMAEDDASIVPQFIKVVKPFVDNYLSPVSCNNGVLERATTHYEGFHKLAYLHPNRFTPDPAVVDRYFDHSKPYFLLRFAQLNAYHDVSANAHGISDKIAVKLIEILSPHGKVFITSERELSPELECYRLNINPLDIHHLMAFATLYIGDSQSMAVEAAMLGTPSIRFNDFAGKIGVLEELEKKYQLTIGIPSSDPERLYNTVKEMINTDNLRDVYQARRQRMLEDKIDVATFFTDFIERLN